MHKRWGWMLTLLKGKHFKVKLLYFKEGGSISLQRHKYRDELWLFIFGKGFMQLGEEHYVGILDNKLDGHVLNVPQNEWHKYKALTPTLVLEIQYGNKCSERDIERV